MTICHCYISKSKRIPNSMRACEFFKLRSVPHIRLGTTALNPFESDTRVAC